MSRFIRFRYVRLRFRLPRFSPPTSLPPNSLPPGAPPSGAPPTPTPEAPRPPVPSPPPPGPPSRRVTVALKVLSMLVALSGLLMTFFLARSGHDTAGLVAVLSALAPLLVVVVRSR